MNPGDNLAPGQRLSASKRLAAALGRPAPAPMTDAEIQVFEAAQDRVDTEIVRVYGLGDQPAA